MTMLALWVAAAVLNVGEPAPPLSLPQMLQSPPGAAANWTALRGKAVVLEFWATWCAPCVAQIPHWNALAAKFKDRPVEFIAISYEDPDLLSSFLEKHPVAGWIGLDAGGVTFGAYGIESVPRTVLVDENGIVRAVTRLEHVTEAHIEALLGGRQVKAAEQPAPG